MFLQNSRNYKSHSYNINNDWDSIDGLQLWRLYPNQPEPLKLALKPLSPTTVPQSDIAKVKTLSLGSDKSIHAE
jgi:hypothetical protein